MNQLNWLTDINSWHGHIQFAYYLVEKTKPKVFVELGTHKGDSYFTFCNAVQKNNLDTKCYAVDTWLGDKHAGFYPEEVYNYVVEFNKRYPFSTLLRMTFDEAKNLFDDESIDILHIDGCHVYEEVKHDFYNWLPKVNKTGIILLHDIEVIKDDFGVYKLWAELKTEFVNTFEFKHSYGLGIIFLSDCELYRELQLCTQT